ncbi:hypothetical protein AJ85_16910 [Alkalihalobacillus alcalophilus ATCC 27647 = CGMCC 1.3604]|uniref:DUF4238 domain-containing protein n=1 Tax=Alkalihalobacillus alcalophilus ATCC 27647 = CGMCC 1.3604 TaxID=1218173 RepID=A0A094WIW5_ALKAL|nr:DUF4238 domain-containing protein [Alkalihalobacillus alcalophilus]KGA96746.1 hypothetical protein BALCAV_0214410 [Alkalihalobacillus alcalophilus ATCC 27647 = CGMCC 1.3604]MED1563820.1 DUF4238 domain-containing protein [Alkalihalobacillus alcalophilus]THG92124.1 hypothetical protein AJ85_16910 [Alkalihalobacillus alcalophilus ATCC 27647 = CGMCC 1.3604]
MGKVKNQHYVPRSYLKHFSNEKGQLWVYDKETDAVFPSNITNVASQRYFYDISFDEIFKVIPEDEKKKLEEELSKLGIDTKQDGYKTIEQGIEDFFSTEIEGPYKSLLENIRSRYVLNPDPLFSEALTLEERHPLSLLIAYQIVRSKEFRKSLIETQNGVMQALVDRLAKTHDKDYEYGSMTVKREHEIPSVEHAQFILGDFPIILAQSLVNHCWIVGVNQTTMPFYTSDNPVIKVAHKRHPIMSYEGYNSEGIEIALPISQKHILIMYERTYHKDYLELDNFFVPIKDVQNVIYYNALQVYQSNRQIYCHDKKFHLIRKMKREYGSLKRAPKKIKVNVRDF